MPKTKQRAVKLRNKLMIKKVFKYFVLENPKYKIMIFGVLLSIASSRIIELELKVLTAKIFKTTSINQIVDQAIKIFAYEIISYIFLELKYTLFFNVYGREISRVCLDALEHIMRRKTINDKECQNGIVQNNFSIGGPGMAKLLYLILLNAVANIIGVSLLLYKILRNFEIGFMFVVLIVIVICSAIQFVLISIEIFYKKLSNHISGIEKKTINDIISNFENIKVSGTEEHELIRYEKLIRSFEKNISLYKFIFNSVRTANKLIFSITRFLLIVFYVRFSGSNGIDNLVIFYQFFTSIEKESTRIGKTYDSLRRNLLDSHFICQYLDIKEDSAFKVKINEPISQIQIRNLSIKNDGDYLMHNLNFTINRGDKICVLGHNGIGKSSFLKALLNLKEYEGGIYINGTELTTIEESSYKKHVSYVPQRITLFDDTIYYNLTYGTTDVHHNEVFNVCSEMDLHDNIIKRTNGYNSQVGEGGRFLSGGEQQKIIIARALLRDTDLFLMDEPCSNLNDRSYYKLMHLIKEMKDKTFIVILHDKKYLNCFQKFLYFDDKGVIEEDDANKIFKLIEMDSLK